MHANGLKVPNHTWFRIGKVNMDARCHVTNTRVTRVNALALYPAGTEYLLSSIFLENLILLMRTYGMVEN